MDAAPSWGGAQQLGSPAALPHWDTAWPVAAAVPLLDVPAHQRLLEGTLAQCDAGDVRRLAAALSPAGATTAPDLHLDMPELPGLDRYLSLGDPDALPADLQHGVLAALGVGTQGHAGAGLRHAGVSGRLMALLSALQAVSARLDRHRGTRTALNLAHTTLRSLGSVGLTTMARQAVGRALDVALAQGTTELTRTLLGAALMAVPVMGQAVLLARDEMNGDATHYARATRVVLMGLSMGVGGLAIGTGTLSQPGLRFAEVVLYPLLRDSVQALFPMMSDPDSGPTRTSLAVSGASYAVNQLGVSRAFAAAPDLSDGAVIPSGVLIRGLANAAGESVDLMSLLYANHVCRHGATTLPRLRIGRGDLMEALRTPLHWDTMFARGCFVSAFNQLYDTLLAEHTLTRALAGAVGRDRAAATADWLTEGIAAGMTLLTYPFWTDPLHARGFNLPERLMEEGRTQGPPAAVAAGAVQYAGNRAEPALAMDEGPVTLVHVDETAVRPSRRVAPRD